LQVAVLLVALLQLLLLLLDEPSELISLKRSCFKSGICEPGHACTEGT
jgi:hypothetical protein